MLQEWLCVKTLTTKRFSSAPQARVIKALMKSRAQSRTKMQVLSSMIHSQPQRVQSSRWKKTMAVYTKKRPIDLIQSRIITSNNSLCNHCQTEISITVFRPIKSSTRNTKLLPSRRICNWHIPIAITSSIQATQRMSQSKTKNLMNIICRASLYKALLKEKITVKRFRLQRVYPKTKSLKYKIHSTEPSQQSKSLHWLPNHKCRSNFLPMKS